MNPSHLVKMANQISDFFSADSSEEEAAAEIASHLQRFWAPAMRQRLAEAVEQGEAADLRPAACIAVRKLALPAAQH
ncbi:formate dehydrogenase subunit delta [Aquitalea sp. LB_tupeE]|uniref:formate dehydrogenase subunit delta n=1 Tax=Aquitalea sp. LB_tupeE TaxID=2748078 RepID=UPI0015BC4B3A|nr:formate dehydrogenase subunit delta [Aquitalea sp. LB_tupeE]NWK78401.1 formate dehydrogenase subunit delta [Aquitalea sp. LB_tupeE]